MIEELLVYDCTLDIKSFLGMLDDTTECYKFYWLDSILQLLARNEEEITFGKVIYGMIADSWYSVSKCNLRLGPKNSSGESSNSIERAVRKLEEQDIIKDTDSRSDCISKIESVSKLLNAEITQLCKNVPYRLLSTFLSLGGDDRIWDNKSDLIDYIIAIDNKIGLPYTIGREKGSKKTVIINSKWRKFLLQNLVTIRAWVKVKKIEYLQSRNPGVPEIMSKVEFNIDTSRNLQKVRKLWKAVSSVIPVFDHFSGNFITDECFDIDHFVPHAHVQNNELWNLMPLEEVLNLKKNNRLPKWDYFEGFADNQFSLNECVYKYPKIHELFNECKSEHLRAVWALEKLYVYGIEKNDFKKILISQIKPLYDSAYNLNFKMWEF